MIYRVREQVVYFPIPVTLVPAVTRFIEEHLGKPADQDSAEVPTKEGMEAVQLREWSVQALRRLRPLIGHNRAAMAALELASERPGRLVSFPEVCERAGLSREQARAGMGALTKVTNRLKCASWPVTFRWGAGGESLAYYEMQPEMAERWLASGEEESRG